jgi:four helix bundle protein
MPVRSFEDLEVYKLARQFSQKIGKLIKQLPSEENSNLKDQVRRAKLSMTNNIAEGFGRYHYQENMQYCRQSRGSICELIDDFNECHDNGYINENYRNELKDEAYKPMKLLNRYIASIKRQKALDSQQ